MTPLRRHVCHEGACITSKHSFFFSLVPSLSFILLSTFQRNGRNRADLESGSRDRVTRSQIHRDRSCHAVSAPRALTRILFFLLFSSLPLLSSKPRLTTYRSLERRRSHRGDGRVGYQKRDETADIADLWKKRQMGPPRAANFTLRSINPNGAEYYADGRESARDFTAKRLAVPVPDAVHVYVTPYAKTLEHDESRRGQEHCDWSWMTITPADRERREPEWLNGSVPAHAPITINLQRMWVNISEQIRQVNQKICH